jgi:predicted double-glycine peptidase
MFFNPNIFLAAVLGVLLFVLGQQLARRLMRPWVRGMLLLVFLLCYLPSALFLAYYLHVVRDTPEYVAWRSLPGTEVLSSLCALLFGFISSRINCLFPAAHVVLRLPIVGVCAVLIFVPYAKSVLLPVSVAVHWSDRWQDGVCIQSTPSTCGPASLATLLGTFGIRRSERAVARGAYSCVSGTELWYLLRYTRQQGVQVTCRSATDISQVHAPALIGTTIGGGGHFIALLDAGGGRVTIGDPLSGRSTMTEARFRLGYTFSGCAVELRKVGGRE